MTWVDAPLYIRCADFAGWMLDRVRRWPPVAIDLLGRALCTESQTLTVEVGLALAFPSRRRTHLAQADVALTRLRLLFRLAERPPPLVDDGARAHAVDELAAIGRLIGGWRRRVDGRARVEARTVPE